MLTDVPRCLMRNLRPRSAARPKFSQAILLELAVESGFADAQHARCFELVSLDLLQGVENGPPFHVGEWDDRLTSPAERGGRVTRSILQRGGQIGGVKDGARAHGAGPLKAVLHLAHVAWPVVLQHEPQSLIAQRAASSGHVRQPLEKMADQQRDVLLALPKG